MIDVGSRICQLLGGQRTAQPVGEPITFCGRHLQLGHQQRHERRGAVAEKAGGELGVVHVCRHCAAGVGEHVEVLLGGVQNRNGVAGEQAPQRRQVDRQRVDQRRLRVDCELHQGQLRKVGALAMELGIERVSGLDYEPIDQRLELGL